MTTVNLPRAVAPLDASFARLIERKARLHGASPAQASLVGAAALLVSEERGMGHSCITLDRLTRDDMADVVAAHPIPSVDGWRELLRNSGVCADATRAESESTPLVLAGDRLYLKRFHAAERRLAAAIRARVAAGTIPASSNSVEHDALFARLFPPVSGHVNRQAIAAATAVRSRLAFITGGPGTGKTTVAARIIALLLHGDPSRFVTLAAPTGRAAARLAEAVVQATAIMDVDDTVRARMPTTGTTLHRLLGYQPWNEQFRYHASNPLAEDVVIVDEASMADLLMMDALFAAVRPNAHLVVLGDPDQLASVDTGFVLGDVARAAEHAGAPLEGAVVHLTESHRFDARNGIGQLAAQVRSGHAAGAMAVLEDATYGNAAWLREASTTGELLQPIRPFIDGYLAARTPAEALAALGEFRVLCALREGDAGVSGLNRSIERWLAARGRNVHGWYDKRPVLITANDPSLRLFNGDVGVTMLIDGRPQVFFAMQGEVRGYSPSRLPAHETAWAITVHKAQGSEFGHVLFVLPTEDTRVMSRELVYTAATRARRAVTVVGDAEVLRTAVERTVARGSGLSELLA